MSGAVVTLIPSSIEVFMSMFNTNPYFIGLMMLMLNLGGRFMVLEVTKGQEKFFQNQWVRRFLIFTVLFVATRNVIVALIMTIVIVLFIGYLFNENSSLCLFGKGEVSSDGKKDTLTVEEMEILNRLTAKAQKFAASDKKEADTKETQRPARIYGTNLSLVQNRWE